MIGVFRLNPVGKFSAISDAGTSYRKNAYYSTNNFLDQDFVSTKFTYEEDAILILALWIIMMIMFLATCVSCTYVLKRTTEDMKVERLALKRNTFT